MPLLEVNKLCKNFGGLAAVQDLDMTINESEIVGLIGPNGAGKSTVLNMIDGTLPASRGTINFKGKNITKLPPYRRTRLGIARVFQRNVLFRSFTVVENVLLGFYLRSKNNVTEIVFKGPAARKQEETQYKDALEILQFFGLSQQANNLATNMPHGSQRALCLAIAMAAEPDLLLLDEPLTGMNVQETLSIMELIKKLRSEKGITCIVVEHNMKAVLGLCERVIVLDYGKVIAEGLSREVVEMPCVIEAYLGAG